MPRRSQRAWSGRLGRACGCRSTENEPEAPLTVSASAPALMAPSAAGAGDVGGEGDRAQPRHQVAGDGDVLGVVQRRLGLPLGLHRQPALQAAGEVTGGAGGRAGGELAVDERGDGLLREVALRIVLRQSPALGPARARWASAWRSWTRPRWIRERTVPSLTPSVAPISS